MKLLLAITFLCLLNAATTTNPIRTIEVVEEPTETFADEGEIPIRIIQAEDDSTVRADEDDPYRLPTAVLPTYYAIKLVLNENFGPNAVFSGSVSINLNVQETVQQITLHAQYLTINSSNVILTCGTSEDNLFSSLTNDTAYHKITIVSTTEIAAGTSCVLQINDYEGILADDMRGLYRSSYTNKDGEIE